MSKIMIRGGGLDALNSFINRPAVAVAGSVMRILTSTSDQPCSYCYYPANQLPPDNQAPPPPSPLGTVTSPSSPLSSLSQGAQLGLAMLAIVVVFIICLALCRLWNIKDCKRCTDGDLPPPPAEKEKEKEKEPEKKPCSCCHVAPACSCQTGTAGYFLSGIVSDGHTTYYVQNCCSSHK